MSQGDWFYKMFLGHYCLGEQCVKACKYKYDNSSADIRIGDLWGNTYKDDEKGGKRFGYIYRERQVVS